MFHKDQDVTNMLGNLVGGSGWSHRATSWDRKVRCIQGLQNFHLHILVDSSGETSLLNSSVLMRESLHSLFIHSFPCYQGVSRALADNSKTFRLPTYLHERLIAIRGAKYALEDQGVSPTTQVRAE